MALGLPRSLAEGRGNLSRGRRLGRENDGRRANLAGSALARRMEQDAPPAAASPASAEEPIPESPTHGSDTSMTLAPSPCRSVEVRASPPRRDSAEGGTHWRSSGITSLQGAQEPLALR